MGETITLIEILTDIAPLVLSTLILGGIVILTLYIIIRIGIPALNVSIQMFETQRQSWATLLEEQKRWHQRLAEDLKKEIIEQEEARVRLEKRVVELEQLLAARDARISKLETEVEELREEDLRKEKRIADLTRELEQVKSERDGLRQRLEALEAASKDDGKKEGGKTEHEKPAAHPAVGGPVSKE